MSMAPQQRIHTRCAENIALLHLLHDVPELPSANLVSNAQSVRIGYSLPFKEERNLAGVFAFLAQKEDDPNHIPAVCLRERPKQQSLDILLAVNRSHKGDGSGYLLGIKAEFEKIATALRQVNDHSSSNERDIFTLIISMCRERILGRLDLAKKRKQGPRKQKTSIIHGLQLVVNYLNNTSPAESRLFLEKARSVLKLAAAWNKHQTTQRLQELVEGVNDLRHVERFKQIMMESCPDREIEASRKLRILNTIRKVSRYRESARILFQAAIKFPLLRKICVVIIELPDDAFSRPIVGENYCPTLPAAVARVPSLKKPFRDVDKMCGLLNIPTAAAKAQYIARVKDTLENSKVHAEIQLLYFCQTVFQGVAHFPRVICSSKSACWLCNAFILHHGKIHIPRSHGKVYPGWRLPNLYVGGSKEIAMQFNVRLESVISKSIKTLYERRSRINYLGPVESEVSTIMWSVAHSNNSKLSVHIISAKAAESVEQSSALPASKQTIMEGHGQDVLKTELLDRDENYESSDSVYSGWSSSIAASDTSSRACAPSALETSVNTTSCSVELGGISSVYQSGPAKLQFEYSGDCRRRIEGDSSQKELSCTAQWLSMKDVHHLGIDMKTVIDYKSLTREEISHNTGADNSIYLGLGETVLKLTMRPMMKIAGPLGDFEGTKSEYERQNLPKSSCGK
ncbi:hypothetical protein F4777DRAFT_567670 [Nemania sp. FL0916]|nr:hypothetical protein F4777DRAFT_567670 [Nemania sp. FL0916]